VRSKHDLAKHNNHYQPEMPHPLEDHVENLLETEVDRREFLAYCGAALMSVLGVSGLIMILIQQVPNHTDPMPVATAHPPMGQTPMARISEPGGDAGNWGDILQNYLRQEHDLDGSLKNINPLQERFWASTKTVRKVELRIAALMTMTKSIRQG
jgi:hypothetical protein